MPKIAKICPKIAHKKCPKQSVKNFFDNPFENPQRTFFETVRTKIHPSKKSVCLPVKKSVRHKKGPTVGGYWEVAPPGRAGWAGREG